MKIRRKAAIKTHIETILLKEKVMPKTYIANFHVIPGGIAPRRRLARYVVPAVLIMGQFTFPALGADRSSIRGANKSAAQSRTVNANQNLNANRNTNVNANQNINVNQNANVNANRNVNVNQNTNVNANRNVNVNNDVNVNVDRDIHGSVNVDYGHDDHFWGGVAVGVASTLVVGAIVKEPPPNPQIVVVSSGPSVIYADGVYYQQAPTGYVVVPAPPGASISNLPPGTETIAFNSVTYYYSGGVFYAKQGAAFLVVNSPIGITVATLPPGATQTVVSGNAYFLYNGVHYKPVLQQGTTVYTTVKL